MMKKMAVDVVRLVIAEHGAAEASRGAGEEEEEGMRGMRRMWTSRLSHESPAAAQTHKGTLAGPWIPQRFTLFLLLVEHQTYWKSAGFLHRLTLQHPMLRDIHPVIYI